MRVRNALRIRIRRPTGVPQLDEALIVSALWTARAPAVGFHPILFVVCPLEREQERRSCPAPSSPSGLGLGHHFLFAGTLRALSRCPAQPRCDAAASSFRQCSCGPVSGRGLEVVRTTSAHHPPRFEPQLRDGQHPGGCGPPESLLAATGTPADELAGASSDPRTFPCCRHTGVLLGRRPPAHPRSSLP